MFSMRDNSTGHNIVCKGVGSFLVLASLLESFAPHEFSQEFRGPESALMILIALWNVSLGILLWSGWAKPFGWMAAVVTLALGAIVFFLQGVFGSAHAWEVGPIVISHYQAMGGSLVLLTLALVFSPPKKDITRELEYLLPIKKKDTWKSLT